MLECCGTEKFNIALRLLVCLLLLVMDDWDIGNALTFFEMIETSIEFIVSIFKYKKGKIDPKNFKPSCFIFTRVISAVNYVSVRCAGVLDPT